MQEVLDRTIEIKTNSATKEHVYIDRNLREKNFKPITMPAAAELKSLRARFEKTRKDEEIQEQNKAFQSAILSLETLGHNEKQFDFEAKDYVKVEIDTIEYLDEKQLRGLQDTLNIAKNCSDEKRKHFLDAILKNPKIADTVKSAAFWEIAKIKNSQSFTDSFASKFNLNQDPFNNTKWEIENTRKKINSFRDKQKLTDEDIKYILKLYDLFPNEKLLQNLKRSQIYQIQDVKFQKDNQKVSQTAIPVIKNNNLTEIDSQISLENKYQVSDSQVLRTANEISSLPKSPKSLIEKISDKLSPFDAGEFQNTLDIINSQLPHEPFNDEISSFKPDAFPKLWNELNNVVDKTKPKVDTTKRGRRNDYTKLQQAGNILGTKIVDLPSMVAGWFSKK
jgi:hypothetical protein